jgi:hypothetical protein
MRAVARRHLRADHQSRAYRDARESARGCHASVRLPGPREKAATTTLSDKVWREMRKQITGRAQDDGVT